MRSVRSGLYTVVYGTPGKKGLDGPRPGEYVESLDHALAWARALSVENPSRAYFVVEFVAVIPATAN